jgi:predicted PurR-regulated permease PerM
MPRTQPEFVPFGRRAERCANPQPEMAGSAHAYLRGKRRTSCRPFGPRPMRSSEANDADPSAPQVIELAPGRQTPTSAAPVELSLDEAVPSAPDLRTIFQGGIFLLLLLAACYGAAEIVLPIAVAFVLMLVLQPAMRFLQRWHVPRGLAAAALIVMLFGTLGGLGTALSGPAAAWVEKVPAGLPKLQERLSFLSKPIAAFQHFVSRAENLASEGQPLAVAVEGNRLSDRLLSGTRSVISGVLETVLVLLFLLVSGDTFLRRLVDVLPNFRNKRQAVDIAHQIESDISAYLVTITLMNAGVGVGTGIVAAACGLGDPVLWERWLSC